MEKAFRWLTLLLLAGSVLGCLPLERNAVLIHPQEAGVLVRAVGTPDEKVSDTPLGPGWHLVNCNTDQVIIYSTVHTAVTLADNMEAGRPAVEARTEDGHLVVIEITVIFRVTPKTVVQVYRAFGTDDYVNSFVIPIVQTTVRDVISRYGVLEVWEARADLPLWDGLNEELKTRLLSGGIELQDSVIRNVILSQESLDMIQATVAPHE
ncbi:MAG: SPFH domain-containing protein [Anaerolineae bacterium]|nr:SPFH domain-containing protein [Anaerolineae bacterium]